MNDKISVDDYLYGAKKPTDTQKPDNQVLDKTSNQTAAKRLFGRFAGIGRAGEYLAGVYGNTKTYQGVDLNQATFEADIFRRQTGKLGQMLFANALNGKAVKAYQFASRFDQQDHLSTATYALYAKIAEVAEFWAQKSLAKDERFFSLDTMSLVQKHAFANDIANQNRTLVSVGGVAGFLGLKGVVLDTAWLLLISLKSIYQLARIYDKPLTNKEGVRLAYGILSVCDLEKLQEKQVIMTALAVGDTIFKNAESTSLADELKALAEQYQSNYAQKIDGLSDFVDLNKFNSKWLRRLLPVASTAVAVHYNNALLQEVLGVAQATFANNAALLENKS